MKWLGMVTDSSPIDSAPGKAVYQQNTRTRVAGELRRRRGMARSSLTKLSTGATGQAATNNNVGPFTVFQVGATLEGVASGYALWGDAQLLRPAGFAMLSVGVYTITVNRQGDTTAQAYVILAKSGNYPVSYEDGVLVATVSTTAGDNSVSTTWTATSTGDWYFAAYGVANGISGPIGAVPVVSAPETTVNTLARPGSATASFGVDVQPYSGYIAIGDTGDATGGGGDYGAVHIYDSAYTLLDSLYSAGVEKFGNAIAWGSPTLFVATSFIQTHSGYATTGAMSVYSWDGVTATQVEQIFAATTAYAGRQLGHGVAVINGGSIIYAGAPFAGGAGPGRMFILRGSPTSHDDGVVFYGSRSSIGDQCGRRVAVSANGAVLALSAPAGVSTGGNSTGIVFVYDIGTNGTLSNEFIAEPTGADDAAGTQWFGFTQVAFSADGQKMAIGADDFAYYYERRGGAWIRAGRVALATPTSSVYLSSDGAFLVIGASVNTYVYSTTSLTLLSTIVMAGDRRVCLNGSSVIAVNDANGVYKYTSP